MSVFDLAAIGANAAVAAAFEPFLAKRLELARVSAVHREQLRLLTASGDATAELIGALLYRLESRAAWPAVGDWVAVQRTGPDQAMVHAVLPRRTLFSRRAPGRREEEQAIAANVDVTLIVCGLDRDFNPRRIERYLALTRESGAAAAVVLNKADLCDEPAARVDTVRSRAPGVPVVALSALAPEAAEALRALIPPGHTAALLGSSGVGKSTLVNLLLQQERQRVQPVRESDSRGRHTTTHRELLPLPGGGALIDTPGMRELQLWAGVDSIDASFDEVTALAAECRFRNCQHRGELGCAIEQAVRDGEIPEDRWLSYQKLRAEAAFHVRKTDVLEAQKQKQQWKQIHKAMRRDKKPGR